MKNMNNICWQHKNCHQLSHLVAEIIFIFLIVYLTGSSSEAAPFPENIRMLFYECRPEQHFVPGGILFMYRF